MELSTLLTYSQQVDRSLEMAIERQQLISSSLDTLESSQLDFSSLREGPLSPEQLAEGTTAAEDAQRLVDDLKKKVQGVSLRLTMVTNSVFPVSSPDLNSLANNLRSLNEEILAKRKQLVALCSQNKIRLEKHVKTE